MPELPEVELVARAVGRLVAGHRIEAVEVRQPKLLAAGTPEEFAQMLRGATFTATGRRGKHILLHFDKPLTLIVHLRMTGRFLYLSAEDELPKHAHVIFYLDNAHRLVFVDPRRFGFMRLVTNDALPQAPELARLAPEPLSDAFTAKSLYATLQGSRRAIKELLLDQTRVNGLGNIYAVEALFLAGIHPQTASSQLSRQRARRLHQAIVAVLSESIAHGSTLNVDPQHIDGSYYGGPYEHHWRVYDRAGQPCPRCATEISRIAQGNRSTYFCPHCQRALRQTSARHKKEPTKLHKNHENC